MSKDRSNLLIPFLAGLTAGAVLGLLFAPRSGKETRAVIKDRARQAKDAMNDLADEARTQWSTARGKAADAASMTKDEANDMVRFLFTEGRDLVDRLRHNAEHHSEQ